MRRAAIYRIQRFFVIISFVLLGVILIIAARLFNMGLSWDDLHLAQNIVLPVPVPVINDRVAIVSGHSGYDSGAVCADSEGNTTLTEAEVNADIAERTANILRDEGTDVIILQEYDPRLDNLDVDAFLSLHSDSCINTSGYKAASYLYSAIPEIDASFVECIDTHYSEMTGLTRNADTITHNMTEYHAFHKIAPTTPAAILELGFLGGDQELLTTQDDLVAHAVAESIHCFLDEPEPTPTPAVAADGEN